MDAADAADNADNADNAREPGTKVRKVMSDPSVFGREKISSSGGMHSTTGNTAQVDCTVEVDSFEAQTLQTGNYW
jgi:hypothetical protein